MIRPLRLVLPLVLASPALAQQFTHSPGLIPGSAVWSEGVECADVDNDGDLDIFFADGEGFSSPGTQRVNRLVMNLLEGQPLRFVDQTTTRLGSELTHGRGVTTGDIDSDGWVDALFANAFNTDPPSLYVNRGVSQPGFYDQESSTRGFTEALSSAGAQFGDLDNDGDLDVIINDSGSSFLGGAGDEPRLYFNDGAGNFTENAAAMNAPAKAAQMDVQLFDIDGDWSLDFFGACRANNSGGRHYLMLNDGTGTFATDSSGLISNTSNNVYEGEVGDLDGDEDLDLFFVSSSSFAEGHFENRIVPTLSLSFVKGATFSGDDDNEVVFLDYNNDDRLDVLIGSLGSKEKLFRNDGNLNWTVDSGNISTVGDPTLDATAADLDNDGDYDIITAQGEGFPSSSWGNKIYVNNGSPDTRRPIIVREEALAGLPDPDGPWTVRAEVRDQVMDDGKNWVRGEVDYVVLEKPRLASVSMAGFSFVPQDITVDVGTTVTWDNPTGAWHTVTSLTSGYDFNSGQIDPGQEWSHTFVRPGVYDYFCIPHQGLGMVGTVTVTGSTENVAATYSGGGIYRFEMSDTLAGTGTHLIYELRFTDWAGNVTVSDSVFETIVDCSFVQYGLGITDPAHVVGLDGSGSSVVGNTASLVATNTNGIGVAFFASLGPDNTPGGLGGISLVDPVQLVATFVVAPMAGMAQWDLALPDDDPFLVGFRIFFQVASLLSTSPDVWEFSNGLEMLICPTEG